MNNKRTITLLVLLFVFATLFLGLKSNPVLNGLVSDKGLAQTGFGKDFLDIFRNLFDRAGRTVTSTGGNLNFNSPGFKEQQLYKPALDYEEAVVNSVKGASPSVVSIIISKDLPVVEQYFVDPFNEFNQFFGPFGGFDFKVPQYRQKGTEKKEIGGGTGFVVSADGLIVTNKHVVSDEEAEYTVLLNDGRKFSAKVLARHPVDDIAVIKINTTGLSPLKLGDSDSVQLGQTAIAIGNALGEFRNTVSVGVISGLARNVQANDQSGNTETLSNVIQTDAAINPGNSGGPLLNLKGEVIALNTAIVSGAQNIGFAIPINRVKNSLQSVQANGRIVVPYVGVRYVLVNDEVKKKNNLPYNYGAFVLSDDPKASAVMPNSPASKAGVLPGDLILEYNGIKIDKDKPLSYLVGQSQVGDTINLKVWRNNETLTLKVTLERRPEESK